METLEGVVVCDQGSVKLKEGVVTGLENVIGVGDVPNALKIALSLEKKRRVFLFTTEGDSVIRDLNEFGAFINQYK